MAYPRTPDFNRLTRVLAEYARLRHEQGGKGIGRVLRQAERGLQAAIRDLQRLAVDEARAAREPDDLPTIRNLRPAGPRRMWDRFDPKTYADRLRGAMLGRFAGCTLGAPVEGWPVDEMASWAKQIRQPFPPREYWRQITLPHRLRYGLNRRDAYTGPKMRGAPVDDDIAYTLLGLLTVERFGPKFTVADNGKSWLKHLPFAFSAEDVTLKNLRKKVPAGKCGERDNPYCGWIGADIRSDPWGYMAPGWPEFAADMAYRDAYLSHRRTGIHGAMFFAAVISAAFALDEPLEAIEIGLTEIPRRCALAMAVRWALKTAPQIADYRAARAAVDKRFDGMSSVHTINNACLTIFGLAIGGTDFTKVISQTVAMGLDNDCTAATAGSIVGACVGRAGVPEHWTKPFGNTVHSYLIGAEKFRIDDLCRRFARQARNIHSP